MKRLRPVWTLCVLAVLSSNGCATNSHPTATLAGEPNPSALEDPKDDTSFADFLGFILYPLAQWGASK
jgi:hypothetical protein